MPVSGTYKLEKSENVESFLIGLGVKEDKAKALAAVTDKTVTLNYTGDKLELESKGKEPNHNTLVIGSPSTFTFGSGFEIEVTLTVSGNVGKGVIKKGDRSGEITIEYKDGTLTETFSIEGNTAKRVYKQV